MNPSPFIAALVAGVVAVAAAFVLDLRGVSVPAIGALVAVSVVSAAEWARRRRHRSAPPS